MAERMWEVRQFIGRQRELVRYTSTATGYKGWKECLRWAKAHGLSAAQCVITDIDDTGSGNLVIREYTSG